MAQQFRLNRRDLIRAGGFLTLSFGIAGNRSHATAAEAVKLPGDLEDTPLLSAWIRIDADETVALMIGKVELGQGAVTAVAQVCADELDIDLKRLRTISGDTALVPNEGVTAGSQSMPNCASAVKQAAAEVRHILLQLAAEKLKAPISSLKVEDGTISGEGESKITYWELVTGRELERKATGKVKPKDVADYKYIGTSVPRLDIPAIMTGQALYIQERRPDGMVHGAVVRPPTYKAKLKKVDTSKVGNMPGVLKVVRNGSFLGIIASRQDQAYDASSALAKVAEWDVENDLPGDEGIFDWLLSAPTRDEEIMNETAGAPHTPSRVFEATYERPYQMHGSIGPSAAIATLSDGGMLTIQTHSQSVFETAKAIARMLGLDPAKVRCQHIPGSGCYGHNLADDAAADAALLAMEIPGKPVRLQYTRPQEHKWEPYGSAMVVKTRVGVDDRGDVLTWNLELWSTPHGTRPDGEPGNLLSARYLAKPFAMPMPKNGGPPNYAADRNAIALYDFPAQRVVTHFISEMPLRVSSTRSLGAYANVFAIESTMDALAHAAGADPVEYRLRFLKEERARDVLKSAAQKFGWDQWRKSEGRGRGIGFARYKNLAAMTAVAIEVEVNRKNGRIRLIRVVAANDSGQTISPDGITNQIEGGVIQSLSWTLKEEVRFDKTSVLSEDWKSYSYPILTFEEVPPIDVTLINRPGEPFLGTGEAAQGPTAAALGNAVFDATGVRFRRIPFTPKRILAGLKA
ncbi:xanthine dehydrogenase family protein molybdopterin-binding subunit [Mesorhizobium waimense]|uniref:Xanthine dehydrogenase family protein molybdopterin-binding subunit n=1 Tax=Mesorhizobium waimense TaxID=1300307 RepID=A0A3A5KX79_9HYPH|nr:xanthine dehydrogenase family protein molybdopterin-binding subunit [Mesorhizobium waimense]